MTPDPELNALDVRIATVPLAADPDRAASVLSTLSDELTSGQTGALLEGAAGSSPYLARLIRRNGEWLAEVISEPPETVLDTLLQDLEQAVTGTDNAGLVGKALRVAKSRAALIIALADLAGVWPVMEVTAALTRLSDMSVGVTSRWLLSQEIANARLPGLVPEDISAGAGYVILAMGKMGAGELNYSSDIDLIALFDDSRFSADDVLDARARYIHVTRQLVKLLSENTSDGYAFRTDLRLRPSPSTTPVCMAIDAAERYYESVGRTWERAAHIKARPLVDTAAGEAYLKTLTPFIWRRNLDFAAIEDTHDMLRKIRAQKASFSIGALPGHDVKLGPGGIREIEFFTQTRQLIMGGRDPGLRGRTTLGALDALAAAGWIERDVRDVLQQDYMTLRTIENRLQMIDDAQTHAIPTSDEVRARLAGLCGTTDQKRFEADLVDLLRRVHDTCDAFFASGGPAPKAASTSMSTEEALAEAGFDRPADAARQIAGWREGKIAATRSERARALIAKLEAQIVRRLGGASNPDQALGRFDRFLSGLPAGVQVFSLFTANPQVLDLIVEICAGAPRLGVYLGRHPHTLDALIGQTFWEPLPELQELQAELDSVLAAAEDYERVLDAARRWSREYWFRAGVHLLRGISDASETGQAYTRIAEACIASLLPHVIADFSARHGKPPGNGLAVIAMGKLGSGEMTAGSDLDLITVYDSAGVEASDGKRPLAAQAYYPRLTQSLVAAMTAPTAEGVLYEVDMRLRPSGRMGPVAVSLASFESYQRSEAWVWEHMALTRARCVAGPQALQDRIAAIGAEALAARRDQPAVMHEAREMRAKLAEAHQGSRDNPWVLKHTAGGLMAIEFAAQTGVLLCGLSGVRTAAEALPELAKAGWLRADQADILVSAHRLMAHLQHIERIALDSEIDPSTLGGELRDILARAANAPDFDVTTAMLCDLQAQSAEICESLFGDGR